MKSMENTVVAQLGQRIRELRKIAGMTQEQFAEQAGLHPTYVGGVERGTRNISIKNLAKLAVALRVPLKDLFVFPDAKNNHARERVKALVVKDDERMRTFFSTVCEPCPYLTSFACFAGQHDASSFYATCCKNCTPFLSMEKYVRKAKDTADA